MAISLSLKPTRASMSWLFVVLVALAIMPSKSSAKSGFSSKFVISAILIITFISIAKEK